MRLLTSTGRTPAEVRAEEARGRGYPIGPTQLGILGLPRPETPAPPEQVHPPIPPLLSVRDADGNVKVSVAQALQKAGPEHAGLGPQGRTLVRTVAGVVSDRARNLERRLRA